MKGIHFISLACFYLDLTQGNAATVLLYVHLATVSTMLCDGKLEQLLFLQSTLQMFSF